jgi:hypothetical protein
MILRALYQLLLRFRPAPWREEMLATFEDAQADARSRGWFAYTAFALREMSGVVSTPNANEPLPSGRLRAVGFAFAGLSAGLVAGWVAVTVSPTTYTSSTTLRTVPSQIPQRFMTPGSELTVETLRQSVFPTLLSRNTLHSLVQTYDLYRAERNRLPMEDVLKIMQSRIQLRAESSNILVVAFSDPNRYQAQRVTRDLMTRVIDETMRERFSQSARTVDFLKDALAATAFHWDELTEKLRGGGNRERLQLERDLTKRRYEAVYQQLAEAEALYVMEQQRKGPSMEVLDLPTLPEMRDGLNDNVRLLMFTLSGLALGTVGPWLARIARRRTPAFPLIARA